jgi:hypothetical protein
MLMVWSWRHWYRCREWTPTDIGISLLCAWVPSAFSDIFWEQLLPSEPESNTWVKFYEPWILNWFSESVYSALVVCPQLNLEIFVINSTVRFWHKVFIVQWFTKNDSVASVSHVYLDQVALVWSNFFSRLYNLEIITWMVRYLGLHRYIETNACHMLEWCYFFVFITHSKCCYTACNRARLVPFHCQRGNNIQ